MCSIYRLLPYYKIKIMRSLLLILESFSQMFERMRHDFHKLPPLRDRALSHFGVHISPCCIWSCPFICYFLMLETLDIAQTVIVFSAVITLFDSKKIQLPKSWSHFRACPPFVTPVMTTSGGFRLHENCFCLHWYFGCSTADLQWRGRALSSPYCFSLWKRMPLSTCCPWFILLSTSFTFEAQV